MIADVILRWDDNSVDLTGTGLFLFLFLCACIAASGGRK